MSSIDFKFKKTEAEGKIEEILAANNISINSKQVLKNGYGTKIFCSDGSVLILYYKGDNSSKLFFEKTQGEIISYFTRPVTAVESVVEIINDKIQKVQVTATFKVSQENRLLIKEEILNKYKNLAEKAGKEATKDTILYIITIIEGNNKLTITQFKTNRILIQGADSYLVDEVKSIINKYDEISQTENALIFVPEDKKNEVKEAIENFNANFPELIETAKNKISEEAYDYLYQNDKAQMVSALGVLEAVKESNKIIPLYNPVIYPFSKVFEGFLIKLMIDKQFLTFEEYRENPDKAQIRNALVNGKFNKYIKDISRDGNICGSLKIVWEDLRCQELHSDPARNPIIYNIDKIEIAENKIGQICAAITDAYRILVKEGFTEDEMLENKEQNEKLEEPVITAVVQPPTQRIREVKEIPVFPIHIGTDESGKGDYFGPLVIAGVCITQKEEELLREIGVKDSKANSDSRNEELAKKIYSVLGKDKISVVEISPEKYNELYKKMGKNLNRILAWGHARVIENLLSTNECVDAIADQFGDESVIKSSLLKNGKNINLIQTPKAERDMAVAAASILARARFLYELNKLGQSIKATIPKGVNPAVENIAKKLVEKNGEKVLPLFVKLHFKTTEKIIKGIK